jgi:hypothetical protein
VSRLLVRPAGEISVFVVLIVLAIAYGFAIAAWWDALRR